MNHAVERLNEIDDKFSVFKPESDISGINAEAGNDAIKISNDTLFLLKRAKEYSSKYNWRGCKPRTCEFSCNCCLRWVIRH
ncbi:MAG: FAD:protein FMN transferase [Clostridiaceae bacterium]